MLHVLGRAEVPNFHIDPTRSHGHILAAIPQLAHLQIWFQSPDDGYYYSPWSDHNTIGPYTCCQRVVIEWIMTFAWPFIMSIQKVIIGRAVKKDSKIKWNGLLALLPIDRVTVMNHGAALNSIFNTPPSQL